MNNKDSNQNPPKNSRIWWQLISGFMVVVISVVSLIHSLGYEFNMNGQLLTKIQKPTYIQIPIGVKYSDVKSIIHKVINYTPNGSAVILIGNWYVQFYAPNETTLYVEAISELYLPKIGNLDNEFARINYTIDRVKGIARSNYHKEYSVDDIDLIIKDIIYIFEEIYKVDFVNYVIDDNC